MIAASCSLEKSLKWWLQLCRGANSPPAITSVQAFVHCVTGGLQPGLVREQAIGKLRKLKQVKLSNECSFEKYYSLVRKSHPADPELF